MAELLNEYSVLSTQCVIHTKSQIGHSLNRSISKRTSFRHGERHRECHWQMIGDGCSPRLLSLLIVRNRAFLQLQIGVQIDVQIEEQLRVVGEACDAVQQRQIVLCSSTIHSSLNQPMAIAGG